MNRLLCALASCAVLFACSAPEVRVGASDGIPAVKGSSDFTLDNFTCGQPITAQGYTVTTTVQSNGDCLLAFDNDVPVLTADDYQSIPELKGATNLVQEIDLQVNTLAFSDATTGMALDMNTYVKAVTLSADGQQVADKSTLSMLPVTVVLSGTALTNLKAAIDARMPASVHMTSTLLVPATPKPPSKLHIDYDAQPTIVLGTGQISLH